MAQLLVRNIEDQLEFRLQRRAKRHNKSMEEEARDILRNALREEEAPSIGVGTQIVALFQGIGLSEEIPELQGHPVVIPRFEPSFYSTRTSFGGDASNTGATGGPLA